MQKILLARAVICDFKAIEISRKLLQKDLEGAKRLLFDILDYKQRDFVNFVREHNLENIGVETEISREGLYCNFIAINKFSELHLTERDKMEFAELLAPEFELVDKSLKNKVIGAWDSYEYSKEAMVSFYERNLDIFEELENLYERHGYSYDYLDKIEEFI